MDQSWVDNMVMPSTSNSQPLLPHFPPPLTLRHGNVFPMLVLREMSPGTKRLSKRLWGSSSNQLADCSGPKWGATDTRKGLISWVEAESLRHLSAKYCRLQPPPRSTIAAAFSPDGKTLASTHGDHTVKIIDCQTGSCLKVLSGHRRTPWVVRFHPVHSEILASGSLDHVVRLWDSNTADCIGSRDFYRPIASIAFHAHGELLAVASGHKLYIWHYNRRGEMASPTIVLKTRRSLRAVHFHPHAAPFLLTAEVNDLNSPDSPMSLATSPGYLQYPPPAVFFANVKTSVLPSLEARVPLMPFPSLFLPTFVRSYVRTSFQNDNRATVAFTGQQSGDSSASAQLHAELNTQNQHDYLATAMDMSPTISSSSNPMAEDAATNYLRSEMENADAALESSMDPMETTEAEPIDAVEQRSSPNSAEKSDDANNTTSVTPQLNGIALHLPSRHSRLGAEATSGLHMSTFTGNPDHQMLLRSVEVGQLHQIFPSADPAFWELPFLQGWLMGQTHAGLHPAPSINATTLESFPAVRVNRPDSSGTVAPASRGSEVSLNSSAMANNVGQSRGTGRSGSRHRSRSHLVASTGSVEGAASISIVNDEVDPHSGVGRLDSELATSLAAAAAAELPCTVKLRIWAHNIQDPCAPLDAEKCRLTIPHAVLCSEMGAHFSPCGRFLAACVACVLPRMEADPGLPMQVQQDVSGLATSPTRHPISAHQVMYELRIYSLEKATFGMVLASRAIRAAHCLTSIQFSPTSEHILLAYGRRHSSLLRSIVVDGETTIPIYTILEVYRVSDMELVRVLPSAEDEVNVACFHPLGGGGLVYGTKEGKLRILQYDSPHGTNCTGSNFFLEENMLEEG